MKNKKITFKLLLIVFLIALSPTSALGKNKFDFNIDKLKMTIGNDFDININNKIKGSKYKWSVEDDSIASVNKKNGIVKAVGLGETTLSCVITTPNKKKYTLYCDVIIVDKPEFFDYRLMAHALGGFDGNKYNNTMEAFELAYSNGFRFIETDILLTLDNEFVAFHGWDKSTYENTGLEFDSENPVLNYDEFMSLKIQGKYNTVDLKQIISLLEKYPDLYLEFDAKAKNFETAQYMSQKIIEYSNNNEDILDRILIQFVSRDAYIGFTSIHKFKYYQYFAYKADIDNVDELIEFCRINKITSVAVNYKTLNNNAIKKFKSNGICILTHTIDDVDLAKEFLDKGVDIICTNYLTFDDFE
jgi:glycerophosphoryl diester phosphodiesterase